MSALTLAGVAGSNNHVKRIDHMGLFPTLRRGDYVIWQDVAGFVEEGLYVVSAGGADQVYQVQNCGGRLRLLWPERDIDPRTRALKPTARPQEIEMEAFAMCCRGFVVASVAVHKEAALLGREALAPVQRMRPALA
ncbi:hypothetical protein [Asaia bogorensis]|uniref:Uncharacterized protein n=1 Tax=Asaia bogorensis NBRC 16594 TaxID=1231624 RepID=A0AAN4U3E0_9PROT|nr:hypothetical protein [Asaia bogorensis]BAT19830.1 hypothetical protein Asbog_01557 [Asaia bogorensis NBRC 16594]GBQ77560.1 hypothetical protein AA0311_1476 [Asaia bogorensis NBRC 16594]GEL54327.1 hypothetical protein ABO01nite_23340 [Asaia bogorensis NBRC 16594]